MNPIYDLPVFFVFVLFFAFKDFFFDVGHFFKAFIEFVTILLLFYVFWPLDIWDLGSPSRDCIRTPSIGR